MIAAPEDGVTEGVYADFGAELGDFHLANHNAIMCNGNPGDRTSFEGLAFGPLNLRKSVTPSPQHWLVPDIPLWGWKPVGIAGAIGLVHTADSAPNGKRCEPFPRFVKGGEDSSTDDVVFPCVVLLFTHWAFPKGIQRRSPATLSKEEGNECKETQLANL